jgi:uncharacterized membrane protein
MAINRPTLPHHHLPKLVRIVMARPRLLMSAVVGLVVFLALLLTDWRMPARLLAGWDVGVALYLVLVLYLAAKSDHSHIRQRSRLQDEGQIAILVLTAIAAFASLGAIFALLSSSGAAPRQPIQLVFATLTIVLSWAFTHTIFALHYAHEYYDENSGKGGGMVFPDGERAEPGLLGLPLFLLRDRHVRAGLRRDGELQADPPHRLRPFLHLLLFQRSPARAHGEHRGQRDMKRSSGAVHPKDAVIHRTDFGIGGVRAIAPARTPWHNGRRRRAASRR